MMTLPVTFKIIGNEPPGAWHRHCRRMLVGPWCNQPTEYVGYNGFVGWAGITRLRSGRQLVTFTSGYWHVSFPQTRKPVVGDPNSDEMFHLGCPKIYAPRGGRAHLMHSDDDGQTWGPPQSLVDTAGDDRHPTILELDDGTWLCTFFIFRLPLYYRGAWMLSNDAGKTWSAPQFLPKLVGGFGNGPTIQLKDGTVVWTLEGRFPEAGQNIIGVYRSENRGHSFDLAATINAGHEMNEPSTAELPDGRLAMICRPQNDLCWSSDGGRTWTAPVSFGVEMFDPHLLLLPNGVLACFHGSYKAGGLRVILSPDLGQTWHGPGKEFGYAIDPSVYGYCHPMLLPDGTVSVVYQNSGGHNPSDARTMAIWSQRVKINDSANGVALLPAPGSPAGKGFNPAAAPDVRFPVSAKGDQHPLPQGEN